MLARPRWFHLFLITTACAAEAREPVSVGVFHQEIARHRESQQGLPSRDVLRVEIHSGAVIATTTRGAAAWDGETWTPCAEPASPPHRAPPAGLTVNQRSQAGDDQIALACDQGLYEWSVDENDWRRLKVSDGLGRLWAESSVRCAAYDSHGRLWFGMMAGVGVREPTGEWRFFEGKDGLPYNDFTRMAAAPDGSVWLATTRGAIRYDGRRWSYRQGLRWLPDDRVRSVVVDQEGTAWFATPGGVGRIERRRMTLAEKAEVYEQEIDRLVRRTEYGYVSVAVLPSPGDTSSSTPVDTDNDGLWTSMYGAGECFAYAATGSPLARDRAKRAFEALRFLQTVTQGGAHSPPEGFVARTVLPTSGRDPNVGREEHDREMRANRDRMWKTISPRWPVSADGEWYWKSDTSSDELDGHYFFYPLYYDLVAEDDAERERVRGVVRRLTDHLIAHDYSLVDHDGARTRWAVFGPGALNDDPRWSPERGLNSLSLLSYLAVARHVTGDERYARIAQELRERHGYRANALVPKLQRGHGSGNQSDDEMAFMALYNLVRYTEDRDLRLQYLGAFQSYWALEAPERNPFFHFAYAALGDGESVETTFGPADLSPWGDWLSDSIETLKAFPLDRANWGHANSHRLDVLLLPEANAIDLIGAIDPRQAGRGCRVDGKTLPVDERHVEFWSTDAWRLDTGGDGTVLTSGAVYLLPYYMGLYHGLIE